MASPLSINTESLLTRAVPGFIATFVIFIPEIIYLARNYPDVIDLVKPWVTIIIASVVGLSVLIGTAINYARVSYYYVPYEFRKLVYKESGDIRAYNRRQRFFALIKQKLSAFYNRFISLKKESSIYKFTTDSEIGSIKELYLSNKII